jgi:transposase-like protein
MNCPHCNAEEINKNGTRNHKQNYICKQCQKQFLESYSQRGYSTEVREICIRMRQNGMKYREIERMTGVNHNTVILWIQKFSNSIQAEDSEKT